MNLERSRPPLEATPIDRQLAERAREDYAEIGRNLLIDDQSAGGTDVAFAALQTKAPVMGHA